MKTSHALSAILIFALFALVPACKKAPDITAPILSQAVPALASPGELVYLIGEWLQLTVAVEIGNDQEAAVLSLREFSVLSPDSLFFLMPDLSPGNYEIVLENADGIQSAPLAFQVRLPRPVIQRIEPPQACQGDTICLIGRNFSADGLAVSFGTVPATAIISISDSLLCLRVPGGLTAGATVGIAVSTQTGTSLSSAFRFCSGNPLAPDILSVTPDTAREGETLAIQGLRFQPGQTEVEFTRPSSVSLPATILNATSTQLSVTVPPGAGSGLIVVSTSQGSDQANIVIFGDLKITRVVPEANPSGGPILIFGDHLETAQAILIRDKTLSGSAFGYFSHLELIAANVPPGLSPGQASIYLQGPGGQISSPFPFEILGIPANNPPAGGTFNVVIPNIPTGYNIGNITNPWMRVDFVNGQYLRGVYGISDANPPVNGIRTITNFSGDTILGFFNENTLMLDLHDAIGWLDQSYLPEVERFVMTPLEQGDQFELFRPNCGGIDSIVPEVVNPGDSVTVYGWPFFSEFYADRFFWVVLDGVELETYYHSIREMRFMVPFTALPGAHELRVGNPFDSIFEQSNRKSLIVN